MLSLHMHTCICVVLHVQFSLSCVSWGVLFEFAVAAGPHSCQLPPAHRAPALGALAGVTGCALLLLMQCNCLAFSALPRMPGQCC